MTTTSPAGARSAAFSILVGLAALAVLLQGVWAGIFLDRDLSHSTANDWVNVHSVGAYVAIGLALAATVVAVRQLRQRSDLIIGSAVFTVLLIGEAGLGSAIQSGTHSLTAVHVPLAMVILGVAVWLPLRARSRA